MSALMLEEILALLYTDRDFRTTFLSDVASALRRYDLSEAERQALLDIDRDDLMLVVKSIARKNHRSAEPCRIGTRGDGF